MKQYRMKQEIREAYQKFGIRPEYFNTQGRMDSLLTEEPFEGVLMGSTIQVLGFFSVFREDTQEVVGKLDNREVRAYETI